MCVYDAPPQVGHLLAIAQSQSRDLALPVITQVMQLLRNAKLAAGRRSSAAAAVGGGGGCRGAAPRARHSRRQAGAVETRAAAAAQGVPHHRLGHRGEHPPWRQPCMSTMLASAVLCLRRLWAGLSGQSFASSPSLVAENEYAGCESAMEKVVLNSLTPSRAALLTRILPACMPERTVTPHM